MKIRLVITALAACLLGLAGAAHAGHGYRDGGHYRAHASHHYRPGKHIGHHYRPHYYVPRYRNVYSHHYYRPYYHHHDRHRIHKTVAGAVLLGTIINAATYNRGSRVVYVDRAPARVVRETAHGDAWYQTDSGGDCFEVRLDGNGNEVWTYVNPAYCK